MTDTFFTGTGLRNGPKRRRSSRGKLILRRLWREWRHPLIANRLLHWAQALALLGFFAALFVIVRTLPITDDTIQYLFLSTCLNIALLAAVYWLKHLRRVRRMMAAKDSTAGPVGLVVWAWRNGDIAIRLAYVTAFASLAWGTTWGSAFTLENAWLAFMFACLFLQSSGQLAYSGHLGKARDLPSRVSKSEVIRKQTWRLILPICLPMILVLLFAPHLTSFLGWTAALFYFALGSACSVALRYGQIIR